MKREAAFEVADAALMGLKDFQRRTVDYAFDRLYGRDPTRRMLVSDEVGLGKTMVARGIVARATVHLWDKVDRLDVVYICSNQDIARQNMDRLGRLATGQSAIHASRLTLLAQKVGQLGREKINFLALTPGTSFDLGGNLGVSSERAVLYWLLRLHWEFSSQRKGPYKLLQGNAGLENFESQVARLGDELHEIEIIGPKFGAELDRRKDLKAEFDALCDAFAHREPPFPEDLRARRNEFVGKVRAVLAKTCVAMLEPDLVILDEFQRFKHLMTGSGDDALLAKHLFEFANARVVLLSATPYKMLTIAAEDDEEDHYRDFLDTLKFLITDESKLERAVGLVEDFRLKLLRLRAGGSMGSLNDAKEALERELRRVIVRTERVAASEDARGMLVDRAGSVSPASCDLKGYVAAQSVSRALGDRDMIELWKSSPYVLNFLDGYKLRDKLKGAIKVGSTARVAKAISSFPDAVIDANAIRGLRAVEPSNARLRFLQGEMLDSGSWRALWVPAALPYYSVPGPFADLRKENFTKTLIFSAWRMVPRAVSTLLSHAANVRIIEAFEALAGGSKTAERWPAPLLRVQEADGRLTGMPLMLLLFPSSSLAKVDPLAFARTSTLEFGRLPTLTEVLANAKAVIQASLAGIVHGAKAGAVDERWYWMAPLLMDMAHDAEWTSAWLAQPDLAAQWQSAPSEAAEGWSKHVDAFVTASGHKQLGRVPPDLLDVLAEAAVASPAVCALRALRRQTATTDNVRLRNAAARVAWSIRNQLNLQDSVAVIRSQVPIEPFWRAVLQYCASGDFQAVMDEWLHGLHESLGLQDKADQEFLEKTAAAIESALAVKAGRVGFDEIHSDAEVKRFSMETHLLSTRFAMQYGSEHAVDAGTDAKEDNISRTGKVQDAFNSPFWPFVLASTSQGQEGLDFHPYCHRVVHWNLPSNPVDLEQREGRVHRYKGHAVRKNVAVRHMGAAFSCDGDPWTSAFADAKAQRPARCNDLVPFWIYPIENGAQIERCVPMMPLSRETQRLIDLRKTLAVYRMVFGQPRQDDLIELLLSRFSPDQAADMCRMLRIDLSPGDVGIQICDQPVSRGAKSAGQSVE